jgi:hypothetical protein
MAFNDRLHLLVLVGCGTAALGILFILYIADDPFHGQKVPNSSTTTMSEQILKQTEQLPRPDDRPSNVGTLIESPVLTTKRSSDLEPTPAAATAAPMEGSLEMHVVDASGFPLEAVNIRLWRADGAAQQDGQTDVDGIFSAARLKVGVYSFVGFCDGKQRTYGRVEIKAGETARERVTMR